MEGLNSLSVDTLIVLIRERLMQKSRIADSRKKFDSSDSKAREVAFGFQKGVVSKRVLESYLA